MPPLLFTVGLVPFTGVLVRYRLAYYPKPPAPAASDSSEQVTDSTQGNEDTVTATASSSAPITDDSAAHVDEEPAAAISAPSFLGVYKRVRAVEVNLQLYLVIHFLFHNAHIT